MFPSKDIFANDPVFNFARHFYLHEHDHPQFKFPHECLACDFKTPYIVAAKEHIQQHGPFHDNKCPNCDEKFYTRSAVIEHFKAFPLHEGYVCGICETVFDNMESKNSHRRKKHVTKSSNVPKKPGGMRHNSPTEKIYEDQTCLYCGKVYSGHLAKSGLRSHKRRNHETPKTKDWICDECGMGFQHKEYLRMHIGKHNKTPCPQCGVGISKRDMARHFKSRHTESHLKPFICEVCKKGFSDKQKLNFHSNIHTGIMAGNCKYCGKGFSHISNMHMHERTVHEGHKRSEKSKRGQNKKFANSNPIQQHRTPNMQKCDQCGKVFSRSDKLNSHIKNVHGEKNEKAANTTVGKSLTCEHCNKVLSRADKLKNHLKSIHNIVLENVQEVEHTCKICNMVLSRADKLKNHLRNIHNNVDQVDESETIHEGQNEEKSDDIENIILGLPPQEEFNCKHCNLVLSRADTLRKHLKNVHSEITVQKEGNGEQG